MATGLLALLDDVATLLDDVATMTKVAGKKTAGLIGDDLAVNAKQVTGVRPNRELGVIWKVFKGGALNKVILIPAALLISAFLPVAITPLLMLGGAYLCYEGAHKVHEKLFHAEEKKKEDQKLRAAFRDGDVDMVAFEKKKIKGAIRTDFILSAEIIVIALGTVSEEPLMVQLGVLTAVAIVVNVGVYGLVAGIVRIDDVGLDLARRRIETARDEWLSDLGQWMLRAAPWVMKTLGVVGTIAMFLVGGGIYAHAAKDVAKFFEFVASRLEPLAGLAEGAADATLGFSEAMHDWAHAAGSLDWLANMGLQGVLGVILGVVVLALVMASKKGVKAVRPEEE
ncbi:MAG: DUF808 domain-containing protein [Persicimonas sp.]